jgi:hypothetical protein
MPGELLLLAAVPDSPALLTTRALPRGLPIRNTEFREAIRLLVARRVWAAIFEDGVYTQDVRATLAVHAPAIGALPCVFLGESAARDRLFLRQAGALVVPRGAERGLLWPATRRAMIRSAKSRAVELIEPFTGADDLTVADVATCFVGALRASPPYRSVHAWMAGGPLTPNQLYSCWHAVLDLPPPPRRPVS